MKVRYRRTSAPSGDAALARFPPDIKFARDASASQLFCAVLENSTPAPSSSAPGRIGRIAAASDRVEIEFKLTRPYGSHE
jgi:hypothetical protein